MAAIAERSESSPAVIEELEGLRADTGKLSIGGTQNMSSKEMEHNFGGIGDESREQNRGYALDSTNYFGGRRILSGIRFLQIFCQNYIVSQSCFCVFLSTPF